MAEFSDTQIAEIPMLNAIENYFTLSSVPLEIESDGLCVISPQEATASRPGASHGG